MHIPDAFIPITQSIVYWIIALVFIALALRWARTEMTEEKIPLVTVLAAGIFAIQAFNIPVTMGTEWGKPGEAIAIIIGILLAFVAVFGASKLVAVLQKKNQDKGPKSA